MILKEIKPIETENYRLRGVTLDDGEALFTFLGDQETIKYITPHPPMSLKEVQEKIHSHLENFQKAKEIPWVIITKKEKDVIGFFRFHKLNLWHKKAEMGVILRKDFQQKGVMTEVLRSILEYGFGELGLNRIVGDLFAENRGSEKLMQKFGFQMEGRFRQTDFDGSVYHDTVVYSLLKSEYDDRKKEV